MYQCRNPSLSCFPARPASTNIHTLAHLRTPKKCLTVGEHLLAPAAEPRQAAQVSTPRSAFLPQCGGSSPSVAAPHADFLSHHQGPRAAPGAGNPGANQQQPSKTRAWNLQSHGGSADSRRTGRRAHLPEDHAQLLLVLAQPPAALPDSSLHAKALPSPPCPLHSQCFLWLVAKTVPLISPASTTWEPGMQSLV